jgi:hypothetical protein
VHKDPEKALDELAEEQRTLAKGLEKELRDDFEKPKSSGAAKEPPADNEGDE